MSSGRSILSFNIQQERYFYFSKNSFHNRFFEEEKILGSGNYGTVRLYHTQEGSEIVIKQIILQSDDQRAWQISDLKREVIFNLKYFKYGELYF